MSSSKVHGPLFHSTVLPNGLTVLGETNSAAKSCAIGFFVMTGACDETPREAGVSHFLEHMMFKGSSKRSALDLTYALGNIGAQSNAYTSEETTVYYASVIPERFHEMHEILCDMLRPMLDAGEYEVERKVILEEIALYQDKPHFFLFERAFADFFGKHPAGNSVLGTTESIAALSRDEMESYFRRRYVPSNMVLVATGHFDWDRFVNHTTECCGTWQGSAVRREHHDFSTQARLAEYRKRNITQSHILYMTPGCSAQDPHRVPLQVLSLILGDSSGSKMYWELIDSGLADSAGADSEERDGIGCVLAYASTETDQVDEVSGRMKAILERPLDFTDAELERAKTKLASRVVLGGELPMGRLMSIGNEWLYRQQFHNLHEVLLELKRVDRRAVEEAVARYPLADWCEFRLLPEVL